MQGRYVISKNTIKSLKDNEQIVLTYKDNNLMNLHKTILQLYVLILARLWA